MEKSILHAACQYAFSLPPSSSNPKQADGTVHVDGVNVAVKVYSPEVLRQLRRSRRLTDEEVIEELNQGELLSSTLLGEYDADSLLSARQRLVIRNLSADEYGVLKDFFGEYSTYLLNNPNSFLPCFFTFFRIETSAKLHIKSPYFVVYRNFFPRLNHDHVFFLDLKGANDRPTSEDTHTAIRTEEEVTWEHEISFPTSERQTIMDQLQSDCAFLQNNNLSEYSFFISITRRQHILNMHLPGMPYGPDADNDADENRKKTLPIRHDIRNGARPVEEQLIPKPRFCDEHAEWEYYFSLENILCQHKKGGIARAFRMMGGGATAATLPPTEFAERLMNFVDTKIFQLPFEE